MICHHQVKGRLLKITAHLSGCVLMVLLLPAAVSATERMEVFPLPDHEFSRYRVAQNDTGDVLRTQTIQIRVVREEDEPFIEITTKIWDSETFSTYCDRLVGRDVFRPKASTRTKTMRSGRSLIREETFFRDAAYFPEGSYPMMCFFVLPRGLISGKRQKRVFDRVFPGGVVFPLHCEVKGIETVQVPAGTFRCRKIKMLSDPSVYFGGIWRFLGRLAMPFLLKEYLWFSLESPHVLVQHKGIAAAPPRDIKIITQLVSTASSSPERTAP